MAKIRLYTEATIQKVQNSGFQVDMIWTGRQHRPKASKEIHGVPTVLDFDELKRLFYFEFETRAPGVWVVSQQVQWAIEEVKLLEMHYPYFFSSQFRFNYCERRKQGNYHYESASMQYIQGESTTITSRELDDLFHLEQEFRLGRIEPDKGSEIPPDHVTQQQA